MGRPSIDLPGGIPPEKHEATRIALGLSRRAYAARIGVPQATYIKKVTGVDASPRSQRRAQTQLDRRHRAAARERQEQLRAALAAAQLAVVAAQARVQEIRQLLRDA